MTDKEHDTVKYGKFEMPEAAKFNTEEATTTFARFIAEPLERGFGHTVGNAMRRMLLTSLECPGVVSVRIEGVPHEYMAVDGIIEDMTNIVLNLKGALLRKLPMGSESHSRDPWIVTTTLEVTQEDIDKEGGKRTVTLGDILESGHFEIVNPELYLFTVTEPMKRQIDLRVAIGRGYVPSERHVIADKVVDEVVMDTSFSPVRLVNYKVEDTRVGQDTDYDRLVLEVTTDGRLTPEESIGFAGQILIRHFRIFDDIKPYSLIFEDNSEMNDGDGDEIMDKLVLRIDEIELSVRSTNCLSGANIDTIAELVTIPERRMLEFRNFGKKSLNEIKAKLSEMGLYLGMDLSRYGITPENVKELMKKHQEERQALASAAAAEMPPVA